MNGATHKRVVLKSFFKAWPVWPLCKISMLSVMPIMVFVHKFHMFDEYLMGEIYPESLPWAVFHLSYCIFVRLWPN